MTPKPGIYPEVSFAEYQQWDAVNNSILREIITHSPMHAKHKRDHPPAPSEALAFGKAYHKYILEPFEFFDDYVLCPKLDKRTKVGKEKCAAFLKSVNGKEIIDTEKLEIMQKMAIAVSRHKAASTYLRGGTSEICIVWIDKATGELCKARIDYKNVFGQSTLLFDLKSTRDASLGPFTRQIVSYGYEQQAAFYTDGVDALDDSMPSWIWVAVEKQEPFGVACYEANDAVLEAGRRLYRPALKIYAECKKKDVWPGYSEQVEMLRLPTWVLRERGISEHEVYYD